MKPRSDEARWLFFDDGELVEVRQGLERLEADGDNTTESDSLLTEIREEMENRERGGDGVWYLRKE